MGEQWFTFQARLGRIVDGDTVDMVADLGFRAQKKVRVRVKGIDTAEIYGVKEGSEEHDAGLKHLEFAQMWFDECAGEQDWPFVLRTERDTGKYGRWPGRIESKLLGRTYKKDVTDRFPSVE